MGRHPDIAENFWKNVRMMMDEKMAREILQHNEDLSVCEDETDRCKASDRFLRIRNIIDAANF